MSGKGGMGTSPPRRVQGVLAAQPGLCGASGDSVSGAWGVSAVGASQGLEGAAGRAGLVRWLGKAGCSNASPKDCFSVWKTVVSTEPGWLLASTLRTTGKQGNGGHPALLLPQAGRGSFQGTLLKPANRLLV